MQYVLEKRDVTRAAGMWVQIGVADAQTRTFRATKLVQGSSYQFRVFAENKAGLGEPAELEQPVTAKLPFGMYLAFVG